MGAVVSASHNPYEDNGIKLFAVGGTKLPDELEQRIEHQLVALPAPTGEPGAIHGRRDLTGYVEHLVAILDGRDLHGLRLVVDAANGAASHLAGEVFQRAGAQVVVINASPDGRNINAGCGATSPAGLQAMVTAERAHAGMPSTAMPTG
jgi:phosphoglucosamine mutase